VTTGELVVWVGATVVVVVGATVVVVVGATVVALEDVPPVVDGKVVGVVVGATVVVDGTIVDVVGKSGEGVVALLPPGCSLATITPMSAAAPVEVSTATLVRRRRRTIA
jgi:hypothetical protein